MPALSPYELVNLLVYGGVATILVAVAIIDWRTRRIPNVLVATLVALRLILFAAALVLENASAFESLATNATASIVFTAATLAAKAVADRQARFETLGLGDVKLIAAACLFLTFDQALLALFIASTAALVLALYFRIRHQDTTFPFGPALSLGFLISL